MSSFDPIITSMLDDDLYKWTMCQAVCQQYPNAQARYKLIMRDGTQFSDRFIDHLQEQIEMMEDLRLTKEEANWLAETCPYLTPVFIDFMRGYRYDSNEVIFSTDEDGKFGITIEGPWYRTILWEVKLMALISELYFKLQGKDGSIRRLAAARKIVDKKKELLSIGAPYADFGTRRRFNSFSQQMTVFQHKKNPNFIGTSNMHFAMEQGVKPIGTMAHEWIMFHGATVGYEDANAAAIWNWKNIYPKELDTILTDTYTSDVFFDDLEYTEAVHFSALRQDSGDPIEFAKKAIEYYNAFDIDPMEKIIIFSDSLNPGKVLRIDDFCKGKINRSFGIGTNLTNDIPGVTPLKMVIKMTHCKPFSSDDWKPTVKLSDDLGKNTGDPEEVRRCKDILQLS